MNTAIDVKGVTAPEQAEAEKEIAEYLTLFKKSFPTPEVNIARIIVAADFEAAVNALLPRLREDGYSYAAGRRSGRAVGKTVHAIKGKAISFSVVLDGGYLGGWADDEKATRLEIIFHELIHAHLLAQRFGRVGPAGFRNSYRTIQGVCFSLALTRDEYIVDSYLDVLCKRALTDASGAPLGLHRLNLARGIDYYTVLQKLLDGMPGVIGTAGEDLLKGRRDIAQIWRETSALVDEIITVFAHLAGSREKEADWHDIQRALAAHPAYQQYLALHLKNIYREWINYFMEDYEEGESLITVRDEIREIFHRCGLRFKNVADGIYVSLAAAG